MQPKVIFLLALLCLTVSCVKDTDFDQADQISLTPEYELGLVYFTVDTSQFEPVGGLGEAQARHGIAGHSQGLDEQATAGIQRRRPAWCGRGGGRRRTRRRPPRTTRGAFER